MKKNYLSKWLLLLCALVAGSGTMWGQTYEKLTSIANIDGSAEYVLGINGTGFHYSGTSSWGYIALPSAQTPIKYTLTKNTNGDGFTAQATISNTTYYLTVPTSKTFTMSTSSTEIGMGTGGSIVNKSSTSWVLRVNENLRAYSSSTGDVAYFYKVIPAFTLTAESNNISWGTVTVSGNKITANPANGYRISTTDPYTITSGSATVVQNGNEFTVTASAACAVRINFEAIPTYTVSFNAEGGTCGTASLTESLGGQGVTLPTATIDVTGWEFVGWATTTVTNNTFTIPTLYKAGSTYKPTSDLTLHAVYTLKETGSTFARVTSASQVEFAKSIVVVYNANNYILNHSRSTQVTAPTESSGEITAPSNTIFTLGGNNTDGFTLTGANGSLSQTTVSTSSSNDRATDWSGNNNQWKIEANANATNTFALSNSTNVALEYYIGWKTEYSTSYNNSSYTAMRLYIPKSAYNSNPSALTVPSVSFEKGGTTLYLDAEDKTYTNVANVTGVDKTINYSSSNTSVATVSSAGVVTAVGIGTATITASVDAELGVSVAAFDTYEITVKSATTLAGIKAQATSSTAVDFTADLANDLVITYVNGNHAYLQSGNVAVYASCAGEGWDARKKFTGAISGKVKVTNNEYQITAIDQTPIDGGVIPEVIDVDIADLTTTNYATYEGRKVKITGASISTAMANTATSGGVITNGTNNVNINVPNAGLALTLNEKGNFTGYIGRYNSGIRLYLYDSSWFTKTHNVPQNQDMSFENASYNLDEETAAVTSFAGQQVTATNVKGAVTYSIKDGSDDIITELNETTGAVALNGTCGTATIVATAAYYEEVGEGGYLTPYKELSKEYTITVRDRYTVTFSVNGITENRRQESYGAAITAPEVAAIGDYVFQGWSDTEVVPTNNAPTMTTGSSITPESSKTVYAVFAIRTQTGTTDVLDQSYSYNDGRITVGGSYTDMSTANPPYYLLHNGGYVESEEFDLSIISKIVVYGGYYGGGNYRSITIGDGTNIWKSVSVNNNNNQAGTNTYTEGTALSGRGRLRITSTCGSSTTPNGVRVSGFEIYKSAPVYGYANYITAVPIDVTITEAKYASYCSPYKLDFSETDVKAYKASVNTETGKVTLTQVDVVPANEGVVLHCATAGTYSIPVTTAEASDVTDNEMVGVLARTQVLWNPSTGVYNYILQQGEFNKATDGYLKANRAYLSTSYDISASGARSLKIVFDDSEATGIAENEIMRNVDNENVYNLSGQRVDNPKKGGLYIVNGKKVIKN